ncbi:MAG: serine/threonine protein kinase [Deltaproteobacteria bacterium]|nr:serine/threonine protein kinase [Deltaproteobacteria bacterium]
MLHQIGISEGETILDRYTICEPVGHGGVGIVVRALDRQQGDREVALKFLYPSLVGEEQMFIRFKNEVALAKDITHKNIVGVYSFCKAREELFFISMEFVRGRTLYDDMYVERKRFSLREIILILDQIAQGLVCAHNHGIIHRDLKPENILIDAEGTLKVTDFGFATALDLKQRLTQAGTRVGTPLYMAPEQFTVEPLDARVDIYALGILGYELALGEHPYEAQGYGGINAIRRILEKPLPKLATEESGFPMWFEKILRKCSAKEREERFNTMAEFLTDLRNYIHRLHHVELDPVVEVFHEARTTRRIQSRPKTWLIKFLEAIERKIP